MSLHTNKITEARTSLGEWYDLIMENQMNVIHNYVSILEKHKSDFLELSSGTGRILTQLLQKSLMAEGLEIGSELRQICAKRLQKHDLQTNIYAQTPETLSLSKKYGTIYSVGGTFCLVTDLRIVTEYLRKLYQLLLNGGSLIIELFVPWKQIISDKPDVWKTGKTAYNPKTGEQLIVQYSDIFDFSQQIRQMHSRYDVYKNNELWYAHYDMVETRWYGINEFTLMLEKAGFHKIECTVVKDNPFHEHAMLFTATKLE